MFTEHSFTVVWGGMCEHICGHICESVMCGPLLCGAYAAVLAGDVRGYMRVSFGGGEARDCQKETARLVSELNWAGKLLRCIVALVCACFGIVCANMS